MQRCSFIWSKVGNEFKIKHIHFSSPLGELKVGAHERFPNIVGEMSKRYMDRKIKEIVRSDRVSVTDSDGVVRFLSLNDIIYISANQKQTIVHTASENINVRKGFVATLALFPDLIQIHRSYAVNKSYIYEIRKDSVIMTDGSEIHIPVNKYHDVKMALLLPDGKQE